APPTAPGQPTAADPQQQAGSPELQQQAGFPDPQQPLDPAAQQHPAAAADPSAGRSDEAARHALASVRGEVAKAVVGQDPAVPGDVTGSLVYDARTAEFSFREGPVFTNVMLADEINRTPPKTQASLLEAMEERQVSVDGEPRALPEPFMVIATQNPVEYEGTYPLPEAQLDRFLLKLILPLPGRGEEIEVLNRHAHDFNPRDLQQAGVRAVADAQILATARAEVARVEVGPEVLAYIVDLCRATRTSPSLALGVS